MLDMLRNPDWNSSLRVPLRSVLMEGHAARPHQSNTDSSQQERVGGAVQEERDQGR